MEINKILEELDRMVVPSVREHRETAYEINKILKALINKRKIECDFQGWPLEHLTMKDLREFVENNKDIKDDAKVLVLQDDGMGYGAVNGYCTNINRTKVEDNNEEVQIWF